MLNKTEGDHLQTFFGHILNSKQYKDNILNV